jgi:hypothetical protein
VRWAAVLGASAAVATGLALGWAGPVSARHRRPQCVVYRCKTLAATAQIRVYRATNRHPAVEVPFRSSFVRWRPSGRVTPLGDDVGATEIVKLKLLALAQQFVADATESCGREGCASSVARLNAATGRNERGDAVILARGTCEPQSALRRGSARRARRNGHWVTPKGTVAWIMGGSIEFPTNRNNLNSRILCELPPGARTPVVVANSPTIEPRSLAVIPGRLYWLEGGTPRASSIE